MVHLQARMFLSYHCDNIIPLSRAVIRLQALPVGKIIKAKVLKKDNQEILQTCIMCE